MTAVLLNHVGTFFFYILLWYWWNSTSEILADVTREAPSTTSFIMTTRESNHFSYRFKKSTQDRVVGGVGSLGDYEVVQANKARGSN